MPARPSSSALAPLVELEEAPLLAIPEILRADEQPAAVYLASLAPGSRRSMRTALNLIAALLSGGLCDAFSLRWGSVRFQHTSAVRAALSQRYAPASANHRLAALRGVLKAAWSLEQMTAEEFHRAVNFPPVRGESLPKGRALSQRDLKALFEACARDNRALSIRDSAILAILYGVGLRRSEAVALDLSDYDRQGGALTVRSGKGNKARVGYLPRAMRPVVEKWIEARGDWDGPLLLPVLRTGRIEPRRLSAQAVLMMLLRRAEEAGIERLSPHDLRRTFISNLLEAGADISTVQRMAGHANVATTTRYDRRGEGAKKKAAEMLFVPGETKN